MEETSINDEKPDINITRTFYDESHLTKANRRSKSLESLDNKHCFRTVYAKFALCFCSRNGIFDFLIRLAPIIRWLPNYILKDDLVADITGGITVGIMHIPQGNIFRYL